MTLAGFSEIFVMSYYLISDPVKYFALHTYMCTNRVQSSMLYFSQLKRLYGLDVFKYVLVSFSVKRVCTYAISFGFGS